MSLPITAVGPLKVETKPILIVSPASAGFASTSAAAPASQNAAFILIPLPLIYYLPRPAVGLGPTTGGLPPRCGSLLFCARNLAPAASTKPRSRLTPSAQRHVHHNSRPARMARIIVRIIVLAGEPARPPASTLRSASPIGRLTDRHWTEA